MFKKTKKKVSALVVLAMVFTMLLGAVSPVAASSSVNVSAAVASVLTGDGRALGRIDITSGADKVVPAGDVTKISIELPAGVTFPVAPTAAAVVTTGTASAFELSTNKRKVSFEVTAAAAVESVRFNFAALDSLVDIETGYEGAINAVVTMSAETTDGHLIWEQTATVKVADVVKKGTTATAATKPAVVRGVLGQTAGNIRIEENVAGSLEVGVDSIRLTAPAGVTFTGNAVVAATGGDLAVNPEATVTADNKHLDITVTAANTQTAKGRITVSGIGIYVEPSVADGDVVISITGTNAGLTAASVANATVGAAGVKITASTTVTNRFAGRTDQAISTIKVEENAAGVVLPNRSITLTLPEGMSWNTAPVGGVSNGLTVTAPSATSTDGRTLTYWTSGISSSKATFNMSGGAININASAAAGDVTVTIGGTAGIEDSVVVAKVVRAADVVAASAPVIRYDARSQAAGNLEITSTQTAGLSGVLVVALPSGATFTKAPKIEVTNTAGSVSTVTGTLSDDKDEVSFTAPANTRKVVVSGIQVDLDRVPMGTFTVDVKGGAVIDTVTGVAEKGISAVANNSVVGLTYASATIATVGSATAQTSVFTIGGTSYTVNGKTFAMDVAPVIKDGRTLLPLRFAAEAAGVDADQIIWDPVRKTVTLFRGDRVVQVTIGSTTMLINGAAITMDVTPEIMDGRTMLPIRWVAMALRAQVDWNAEDKTVTVKAQ